MGQAAAGGGMSLAAMGFTMLGQYTASRAEAGAERFKAEQLEQQAEYGELKANQTNAQMTNRLAVTLGHIDAVRASAHTDATSPTGAAVRGMREQLGEEAKGITVENILQQTRRDEADAAYARSNASNALLGGDLAMLGTLFGGGAAAMKSFGTPGGGEPSIPYGDPSAP